MCTVYYLIYINYVCTIYNFTSTIYRSKLYQYLEHCISLTTCAPPYLTYNVTMCYSACAAQESARHVANDHHQGARRLLVCILEGFAMAAHAMVRDNVKLIIPRQHFDDEILFLHR